MKNTDKYYNQLLNDLINQENLISLRAKRLIKKGADPNYPIDKDGKTIFMHAVENHKYFLVKLFLKRGASLSVSDNAGNNALINAVRTCHPDMIRLLLENGADPDAVNNNGDTALMYAVDIKHKEINVENIYILIRFGANVNHKNKQGMTPLEYAVRTDRGNSFETVQLLLENGADFSECKNNLHLLLNERGSDYEKIRKLLREYGIKTEPFTIQYSLKLKCFECGKSNSLNAPVRQLKCSNCQSNIEVKDEMWETILTLSSSFSGSSSSNGYKIDIEKKRTQLICPNNRCKQEISLEDIPMGTNSKIICKSCGKEISNKLAPDWLKELVSDGTRPLQIINADLLDSEEYKPVVTKCMSCGSSMKILQETPRVCVCEYCQTQQYLPDEIWLKFYQPYKRRKRWYILFVEDE